MQNVIADLAVESEAATALALRLAAAVDRPGDRARGRAAPDRAAAGEVLGLQAHAGHGRRGAGVPGRQRLRRGVRAAAALPRVPAQLDLGGLGQRQRARRAARAHPRARGARRLDHRGRPRARRRRPPRPGRRRRRWRCSATAPARSRSTPAGWPAGWRLCLQGSLLVRFAPPEVADVFCASRLGTSYDGTFGTLAGGDLAASSSAPRRWSEATATVVSVNVGTSEPNPAKRVGVTGFGKRPVTSALLRPPGPKHGGLGSGLVGDFIGETAAPRRRPTRRSTPWRARSWTRGAPSSTGPLARRCFGENLTTIGLDVDGHGSGTAGRSARGRARGVRPPHPVRDLRRPDGGAGMAQALHRGRPDRRLPRDRDRGHRASG